MDKLDIMMIGPFPEDPTHIHGGVQASVFGLSLALSKRSDIASINVMSLPAARGSKRRNTVISGIDVAYFGNPLGCLASSIFHLPHILRRLNELQNPVLHVHGTGLLQTALCAFARLKKRPLIWTLHGIAEKETLYRFRLHKNLASLGRYILYRFLERANLRIVPTTIVDTVYVKDEVHATKNAIYVIPQGIFTHEMNIKEKADGQTVRILSVGVIDPRKGHHLTLEAFAKVKEKAPHARLTIIGSVTSPDYHQLLIRRVGELGLTDLVDILPNASREEILKLLNDAYLFALHSREESQGIALCEALAVGLPIVSTRVGGIPFVVEDNKNGLLVEYGDTDGFAEALLRLVTDHDLHARFSEEARAAGARYDWDSIADKVAALYRALAK